MKDRSTGGAVGPASSGVQSESDRTPVAQVGRYQNGAWPEKSPWMYAVHALVLLLVPMGLLAGSWTFDRSTPQSALAQSQGFTIVVYDYTGRWGNKVATGVQRWDAGLAPRGIRLSYSRQAATPCENLIQPEFGISVCDTTVAHPNGWLASGEHQGMWATESGVYLRGLVQYYGAAPASSHADMMICHELGHTLQLMHVPSSADSCMTTILKLVSPSTWDLANALSVIPSYEQAGTFEQQSDKKNAKSAGKKNKKGGKKVGKKGGKNHSNKHRH